MRYGNLILVSILVLALGVAVLMAGCASNTAVNTATEGADGGTAAASEGHGGGHHAAVKPTGKGLFVYAGAGIRPPLDELGAMYKAKTGTHVDFSYKGSGCLLTDIAVAKEGDGYIPGETFYMDQALCDGYIAKSRIVSGMTTVMVVAPGNPKGIHSIKDLARPGLRLGFGEFEAVAAGKAAKEALEKANSFEGAKKNTVMSALNIVEVGNAMKLGHIDGAIVWDATAALYGETEMETIPIEEKYRVYSPIPVGVLTFSKQPQEAEDFMNFLASDEAANVFKKHGFSVPETDGMGEPQV